MPYISNLQLMWHSSWLRYSLLLYIYLFAGLFNSARSAVDHGWHHLPVSFLVSISWNLTIPLGLHLDSFTHTVTLVDVHSHVVVQFLILQFFLRQQLLRGQNRRWICSRFIHKSKFNSILERSFPLFEFLVQWLIQKTFFSATIIYRFTQGSFTAQILYYLL
jgi:hypothetical protein